MPYSSNRIIPVGAAVLYQTFVNDESFTEMALRKRLGEIEKELDGVCELHLRHGMVRYSPYSMFFRRTKIEAGNTRISTVCGLLNLSDRVKNININNFQEAYREAIETLAYDIGNEEHSIDAAIWVSGCRDVVRVGGYEG